MESYRSNKFLFITSVLSILVLGMGATFSFFTVSNRSKYDAVQVEADKIQLALSISPMFAERSLIPTNDKDIITAYKNECIDDNKNGACLAYELEVSNFNREQDMIGKISFEVEGIQNLSYMVLDEAGNEYLGKTSIANGKTENMPLGEHFVLSDAADSKPTSKKFILIIWLTNLDKDQTDLDADGSFTAAVSYESVVYGSTLTGTVQGFEGKENSSTGGEEA